MHDIQHTLGHMICMICNYLGKHGQHKINQLAGQGQANKLDTNNLENIVN